MKSKSDVNAIKSQSILMRYIPVLLKWHINVNEFSGNLLLHHSSQTLLCSISQVQTCHTRFDINDAKWYWFMWDFDALNWNMCIMKFDSQRKIFHWLTTENSFDIHVQHGFLCSTEESKYYWFGTTWGWVNNDRILTLQLKNHFGFPKDPWNTCFPLVWRTFFRYLKPCV